MRAATDHAEQYRVERGALTWRNGTSDLAGHRHLSGGSAVEINRPALNAPVRLLFRYDWPKSNELAFQDFDLASEAVFGALGGGSHRVLAEARVRGQVHVDVMSQWPQLAVSSDGTVEIGPANIRSFLSTPSEYLKDAIAYTESVVLPLLVRS